ncbi:cytochrome P450 [Vararia minispora EC-137]|uniref:Cytochrome P450 n=1 Tax=Vararia minispora EC-137 TaxID=1314806 RepID=A0ACB8QZG3_9AGAM|nr:cytochrome P450 [Vararia minispora EC-137]
MNETLSILTLCTILIATLFLDSYQKRRRLQALIPPSHNALPFIGNALSIPALSPWKTFHAWSKELDSELISVWAFGQLTIIIDSAKATRELLSHRSANYVDRPRIPMLDLSGWTDTVTSLMPYGDTWRSHRRILHRQFNISIVSGFKSTQEAQIKPFLTKLYTTPEEFARHVQHFTSSLALMVAYGYQIADEEDELSTMAFEAVEAISKATFPGAVAVNTFPSLRNLPEWFPGAGFHTYAKTSRKMLEDLRNRPFDMVKELMAQGKALPSITRTLLEEPNILSPHDEERIREVASMVYLAGAETTFSAIKTMIMAFALNPEAQRRARVEIDTVTARERLPTLDDQDVLPYVQAIVREALRWIPILPLGVIRSSISGDIYNGKIIPAGTTIFWNAWAITHDPDVYPDPDAFRPERFLDADGHLVPDDEKAVFGYGRRECVGMHFAKNTLFNAAASMLALFEFGKAKDDDGNEIEITVGCTDALVSHPTDFKCSIRPRDEIAVQALQGIGSLA